MTVSSDAWAENGLPLMAVKAPLLWLMEKASTSEKPPIGTYKNCLFTITMLLTALLGSVGGVNGLKFVNVPELSRLAPWILLALAPK